MYLFPDSSNGKKGLETTLDHLSLGAEFPSVRCPSTHSVPQLTQFINNASLKEHPRAALKHLIFPLGTATLNQLGLRALPRFGAAALAAVKKLLRAGALQAAVVVKRLGRADEPDERPNQTNDDVPIPVHASQIEANDGVCEGGQQREPAGEVVIVIPGRPAKQQGTESGSQICNRIRRSLQEQGPFMPFMRL